MSRIRFVAAFAAAASLAAAAALLAIAPDPLAALAPSGAASSASIDPGDDWDRDSGPRRPDGPAPPPGADWIPAGSIAGRPLHRYSRPCDGGTLFYLSGGFGDRGGEAWREYVDVNGRAWLRLDAGEGSYLWQGADFAALRFRAAADFAAWRASSAASTTAKTGPSAGHVEVGGLDVHTGVDPDSLRREASAGGVVGGTGPVYPSSAGDSAAPPSDWPPRRPRDPDPAPLPDDGEDDDPNAEVRAWLTGGVVVVLAAVLAAVAYRPAAPERREGDH